MKNDCSTLKEETYVIHGIGVQFTTNSQAIAEPVEHLLRPFKNPLPELANTLTLFFEEVQSRSHIPIAPSPSSRMLYSSQERAKDPTQPFQPWDLYEDDGKLFVDHHAQGCLIIDPQTGKAEGYLVKPETFPPGIRVGLVHLALAELLKRVGLYTLHAIAMEKNQQGLLIVGSSGHGKTTACISLLRSGYRCLSDDHPLIHQNGNGLKILPFPEKIDVTEQTIQAFPELRNSSDKLYQGLKKRFFKVEEMYPGRTGTSCTPRLILFPQIVNEPKSYVEPLAKSVVLDRLLSERLSVYDKNIARQEFQTLARLVQHASCYRLFFGQNVLELPELINPLLQNAS